MAIRINGEVVQFHAGGGSGDLVIEIDNSDELGSLIELRLTDTNQTDPAGRFKVTVDGDTLEIAAPRFAEWAAERTLISFDADGLKAITLSEAGALSLLENLIVLAAGNDSIGWRLRELVNLVVESGQLQQIGV